MTPEQDIIIRLLTKRLVLYIMEDFKLSPLEAMRIVFNSDTYAQISDIETGRYKDGSRCLYEDLKSEILTGVVPLEY